MKTSNKLLMLLLALLFLIPLMMVMGFKAAIKNNQYTVKNMYGLHIPDFKYLKPFKVIKLNGGLQQDKQLKCNIRYGDKYGYKFNNYDPGLLEEGRSDSCNISMAGDTLVISYGARTNEALKKNNYYYGVEVAVTIPETMPIVASAAMVNVDSSTSRFSSLHFSLTDNSLLNVGNADPRRAENSNADKVVFPKIVIDAASSQIDLNENNAVKNMQVSLKGQSRFNFNEKAEVDTLSGIISDESVINAPYNLVKKLKQ